MKKTSFLLITAILVVIVFLSLYFIDIPTPAKLISEPYNLQVE
tara:strand:+ start:394 stop:522 length:129 start_codon:yes stop_codon:yes gene_type:complete